MKWRLLFSAGALAARLCGSAYFLHYTHRGAPYAPAPEKFDVAALPDKTITFFVNDDGPTSPKRREVDRPGASFFERHDYLSLPLMSLIILVVPLLWNMYF